MKRKIVIISILFLIVILRIVYINNNKTDYKELLKNKTNNYMYINNPRGRILDKNGKILVDNIGVKTIYYNKLNNVSLKEELKIAKKLSNIIDIDINEKTLKNYYLIKNNNGDNLLTNEEKEDYNKRKISSVTLKKIKLDRITDDMLNELSNEDKKIATIFNLMNKDYSYQRKEIKKDITNEEYSKLVESDIKGIEIDLSWDRVYNYKDTLKDIFGTIGYIPKERLDEYLKKGYSLNDTVGLSYLELYYEDYLKGEKDIYRINNNKKELIKKGRKGYDLVLSIDIDAQLKLEELLKENILKAKGYAHTDYFREMYSILGNPKTGEIIAMSGQKLIDKKNKLFENTNTKLINTSYTIGSIVKIGTVSTGYKHKVIDIGSSVVDSCIKLYYVPLKCSYSSLGRINDLTAISKSSNYYQFNIALGLTNQKYYYNMKLDTNIDHFNKFRDMYKEYGLGSITGVDLPNEMTGITGSKTSSDLLLNLSIGQYDTYTPIQIFQYVNTAASKGEKRSPQLMNKIIDNDKVILENKYKKVSDVSLDLKYKERLIDAMHLAVTSGTARGYFDYEYNGAGKTGTAETFIDTNNDGVMDTKTTSIGFVGFAPYDNPKYSIIILAPNIYKSLEYNYGKVYVTRFVSKDIMNFMFENK